MTWDMTRQLAWSNDLTLLHTRDKSTGRSWPTGHRAA